LELTQTKGWKRFSEFWKKSAEETGKLAVFPGLKKDILDDKLIRANQALVMIYEVEDKAAKFEQLDEQAKAIKDLS
jgi:hypothetical protein